MYPLIELGPLRLSSAGLVLLASIGLAAWLVERAARSRGGAELATQAERCVIPALLGAAAGGRLWYGLWNWPLYSGSPGLVIAPRLADLAWPGALLGLAVAARLWCRLHRLALPALADSAALALPAAQALAAAGLLLSGEAAGAPTSLPWGLELLGAVRHPTQLYYALAAAGTAAILWRQRTRPLPPGTLARGYLVLQGLAWLLIEPLRIDSLTGPAGIRVAQVAGLALIAGVILWYRTHPPRCAPHIPSA